MLSSRQRKALESADCMPAFDWSTLQLYSTDASIYQLLPDAVAFPQNATQAASIIRIAAENGVPIIPRGAGTGLAGGALGEGLVLDFSRHNTAIPHLDLERRSVRVGAGVVLDELNRFLKPYGYGFGPDVATSSRATLGGMIANNSSGAHVPVYGTTSDHLLSLEIVLADGRVQKIGPNHPGMNEERESLAALVESNAALIRQQMPDDLKKRWPGYGLDRFLRQANHLGLLLGGSEGTLAGILSAELKIVPLPKEKGLGLLFFDSVAEAMQAAVAVSDLQPAAIEHVDRILFDQTKGQHTFQAARDLLELDVRPSESILIVEFQENVRERLAELSRRNLGVRKRMVDSNREMNLIWALRKAGLSLLTGRKGAAKPVTGIEDTAVRPEQLPEYVAGLKSILDPLGLSTCYYGHAAGGLLHVRPVLDLHQFEDRKKFRFVADQVSSLVRQFKGSIAGEHGVGMARTEYMSDHLGEPLLNLMSEVKTVFDPKNVFNPGKILSDGRYQIDSDLRWGPGYEIRLPFRPVLAFAAKDESFLGNLEQCNGCGGCRKRAPTMCPTFLATGEEIMSTRGRANMIRAVLDGRRPRGLDPLVSPELDAALSNCLSCKACTVECPSNVNMALLKAELLHARFQRDGLPLRERLLGSVDRLGAFGCLAPQVANRLLEASWLREILDRFLGISARRPLPAFATERFDHWFHGHKEPPGKTPRGRVYLWDDTFVRYHEPHIGRAAVRVLQKAGFEVNLLQERRCCGRPSFSQGNLDRARALGNHNLSLINARTRTEPILFLEPSCYSMFVDDYRELGLSDAEPVGRRCYLFEQFIAELLDTDPHALSLLSPARPVAVHVHCHAKSLLEPGCLERLGKHFPGENFKLLNTGCCGMAGAFGALSSKYDLSVKVAEPLVRKIKAQSQESMVVASGTSCRHQIEHLTQRKPIHMAELLENTLELFSNGRRP